MTPTVAYWASLIIGFAAILLVYMRTGGALARTREAFTDGDADADATTTTTTTAGATTTTAGTTTTTAGATTAGATSAPAVATGTLSADGKSYIENITGPNFVGTEPFIYLTSFSDKTRGGEHDVYTPADGRWYSFTDQAKAFSVVSANGVPQKVRHTGISLKNVTLNGPSSGAFRDAKSSVPWEAPSFTAVWYGANMLVGAAETSKATLFRLMCQTPARIEIYLTPAPSGDGVFVKADIGDQTYSLSETPIPLTTFAAAGNNVLYAFTYKKCAASECADGELAFYIGTTAYRVPLAPAPSLPIVLANWNAQINTYGTLDMTMYAFAFFQTVLLPAELAKLSEYFTAEYNNYGATIARMQQLAAANQNAAGAASAASAQAEDLSSQLAMCKASSAAAPAEESADPTKWHIKAPAGATAASGDLSMCSALNLKAAVAKKAAVDDAAAKSAAAIAAAAAAAAAAPAAAPATATAPTTASAAADATAWWRIPYTPNMDSVAAVAPPAALTGAVAAAPRADPRKAPETLWTGIYRQSVAQGDLNAAIATAAGDPVPTTSPVAPVAVQDSVAAEDTEVKSSSISSLFSKLFS